MIETANPTTTLIQFLSGSPSIYDVTSYVIIVLLLVVVISMHLRQMKQAREINVLRKRVTHLDGGAIRDGNGRVVACGNCKPR